MVILHTERLELHALNVEQISVALVDPTRLGPMLNAEVSADVFSEESRQAMTIKLSRMEHNDSALHPWYTYFLLLRASDRRALGVCGFKGAPNIQGSVELGYAIHENYRNQGLMTEAVFALVDWAFTHDSCQRVTAETLRENFASQHVLQKVGLTLDRPAENMLYWKIDRESWEARKAEAHSTSDHHSGHR